MSELNELSFGQRLRRERERLGWSQKRLAEEIGVDVSTIVRWERGQTTPHSRDREKLYQVFGKDSETLGFLPQASELLDQPKLSEELNFGQLLLRERARLGWSQEKLAEQIGADPKTISRWERYEVIPGPYFREKLVQVFDISPEELGLLQEEAAAPQSASDIKRSALWYIPYSRNPFFTGRERELEFLHHSLRTHKQATVAIVGLGGIGKTQVALEYIYRYRVEYDAVFWIRADSPGSLVADFTTIATLLGLPERNESDENLIVQAVRRWLDEHEHWLLAFDGADDLEVISDFLPKGEGHILLTTRSHAIAPSTQIIALEGFDLEEGVSFLLRRAKLLTFEQILPKDHANAAAIVQELGGLPLALALAGAYIEHTQCDLAYYLDLLREGRADLLKQRGRLTANFPQSIATTLSFAFSKAEQANRASAELLRLCAFLHPDAIPQDLFFEAASELGPTLDPVASDPAEFNEALQVLLRYSLLRRNPESQTLAIHRLVQAAIKEEMNEEEQYLWTERAVHAVSKVFPEVEVNTKDKCQQYLSQALACVELIGRWDMVFPAAIQLIHRVGIYLYAGALYREAEPILQRVLAMQEQVHEPLHQDVATSLNDLATLYLSEGKYEQAEPLYRRALEIYEHIFGSEHREVAITLSGLAKLYAIQGKYKQAEPLFRRVLEIRERMLSPDHPDTATTLQNLASLFLQQGKYEQAEPLFRRALEIRERAFGLEHPLIAASLNDLATLYLSEGKYEQAEPLMQRALEIRERMLGPDHPDTATTLQNLALLSLQEGKYEQAEPLFRRALEIYEHIFGSEYREVAITLNGLARFYAIEGKYEQAEPLYRRALEIYEHIFGSEHREVAITLSGLARLYAIEGKYEQAEPLFRRALEIYEHIFGSENLTTAACLNRLANLYCMRGQYEQAAPLLRHALANYEQLVGLENPLIAQVLVNLAMLYYARGKQTESKPILRHAIAVYERVLISEHSNRAGSHPFLYEEGLDPALGYLDQARALNDLGLLLQEKGEIATAHLCFEQIFRFLDHSPTPKSLRSPEQQVLTQQIQAWLRTIVQNMGIAQTSRSKLARTLALNRALGSLSDMPQQLNRLAEIGQILTKLVTDQWRKVVAREVSRVGKIVILEQVRSPYVFTPPVKDKALVGRDDVFERITSLWARPGQRNSLLIHGHRRMGKTSVAQALVFRCNLGDDTQLVYLSLEGQPLRLESVLYQLLSSRIWLRFKNHLIKPKAEDFLGDDARTNFDFFLALLNELIGNARLVLILDEFEMLYNHLGAVRANEIIAYLRAQTVTYTWLTLALVGLSDLDDLRLSYNSSILGWEGIRVSFLDAEQVKNMLANPPQDPDFPLDYTLEALDMVARLTNGQPYLVQVIGDSLVQRYNRIVFTEQQEHSGVFDVNDVQAVLEDPGFYSTAAAYFDGVWEQATKGQPGEPPLLKALAEHERGMGETMLRASVNLDDNIFAQALLALKRHDVLCHQDGNVCYTVPLMCRWVRETHLHDGSQRTGVTYG